MNKEFIPYEQALALKELGFDEPCMAAYNDNHEFKIPYEIESTQNQLKADYVFGGILAPLYQQAFRWLHEQLGFKSSCMPLDVKNKETVLNNNINSLKEKNGNTSN